MLEIFCCIFGFMFSEERWLGNIEGNREGLEKFCKPKRSSCMQRKKTTTITNIKTK